MRVMIANYHTHTWRCHHASGTEREYVENAIAGGLKILGFSDHTPVPFLGGYVSPWRMGMDQLEDYVDTVSKLKEEYKKDIEIHLGFETEYYPAYFQELLHIMEQYPVEYFLLGQHSLGNEANDVVCVHATTEESLLVRYCEQTKEALATGQFTYFAHPDVMHFTGDTTIYENHMRDLCQYAKRLGIPLEMNLLGIWDKRFYPDARFWKIAGETGNQVIIGADAHQPEKVWNPQALEIARKMVEEYRLNLIETVTLRKPCLAE